MTRWPSHFLSVTSQYLPLHTVFILANTGPLQSHYYYLKAFPDLNLLGLGPTSKWPVVQQRSHATASPISLSQPKQLHLQAVLAGTWWFTSLQCWCCYLQDPQCTCTRPSHWTVSLPGINTSDVQSKFTVTEFSPHWLDQEMLIIYTWIYKKSCC